MMTYRELAEMIAKMPADQQERPVIIEDEHRRRFESLAIIDMYDLSTGKSESVINFWNPI